MDKPEEVVSSDGSVAITDPGAANRHEQNRGDRFVVGLSNVVAWIFPILMLAICSQVLLRRVGNNQAWLDDLQWWLYGFAVLIGIAYAVTTDSHVRVDIRYALFSEEKKQRTNVFALGWLFFPFVVLCWDVTIHYALTSIRALEGSDSPNGLHNLWLLKTAMNLTFIIIAIATWSFYVRCLSKLTRPVLWKQLLWAFPSTMYVVNLAVYYTIWWFTWLTSPADTNMRQVSRADIFGAIEIGNYEILYTIIITLVATVLLIAGARLLDRNPEN